MTQKFESEIINAFYKFLLKNGLKESTCNDYCRRILAICKQFHITPEELFEGRARYSIDDLIGIYTNHPEMKAENAKKHNAPLSALKWFKKFMEEGAKESAEIQELKRIIRNILSCSGSSVNSSAVSVDLLDDDFWKAFAEYLREMGLKESTISCYIKQYIKKCLEIYLDLSMLDFKIFDDKIKLVLAQALHRLLYKAIKSNANEKDKKRLQDYNSAVRALIAFLESLLPSVEELSEEDQSLQEEEVVAPAASSHVVLAFSEDDVDDVYTYDELIQIFKSRIATQDRSYKDAYLPCRVLQKIFGKNPKYRALIKAMLDRTVFLLGNNKKALLKDIQEIYFSKGYVWVKLKNGEIELLYTEVFCKGKSVGYDVMRASKISDLTLDHDMALRQHLPTALNFYPNLKKLSDSVVKFRKTFHKSNDKYALAKAFFEQIYPGLEIDEEELLNELCDFYNKINFTIMLGKYNCSKNGRP